MIKSKATMKYGLILFISAFSLTAKSQDISTYLNDTLIKFSILIPSTGLENGFFYNSTKRYIQTNIPDSVVNEFLKAKNSKWMEYLFNIETSFATTLLLYQIRSKDATIFEVVENKEKWMKSQRDKDIKYWKAYLSKNKVQIKKTDL